MGDAGTNPTNHPCQDPYSAPSTLQPGPPAQEMDLERPSRT